MIIRAPQIPAKSSLQSQQAAAIVHEATIEQALFLHTDLVGIKAGNLSFDECILERVLSVGAQLEKLGMSDVLLKNCDLSAAKCAESSWIRVKTDGARMVGTDISQSTIKDVVFEGCKLDMANFRFAKLTRVAFKDCSLAETDFQGAQFAHVTFENCTLTKTEFANCTLKQLDLRTSQLMDIRGWQFLKGAVIDSLQLTNVAPQLAHELGLKIEE